MALAGRSRRLFGRSLDRGSAARDPLAHLPAVLALAAVTLGSLWPAVVHFRSRALADRLDGTVFTWAWWAMPRAIARGESPFQTDQMFHPVGADLGLTTSAPLVSALSWPIRATLGPEAQINTVQLTAGFLAALGAYLLAYRVCRQRGPALLAGVAFTLTSHRFVHVPGHFNLIHTGVLPFGCLLFLRFTDAPSRRRALALGAFVGATFLIEPQLTLLLLLALVPLGVLHRGVLRNQLRALGGSLVLAGLVALPLLVPMVLAIAGDEVNPPDPVGASLVYSASPLSWVLPPPSHPLLGGLVGEQAPAPNIEGVVYPGLVVLGLAVAGVQIADRERRRGWVAIALVGFVLSLGPYPVFYDTDIRIPLPWFALRAVPGLEALRAPGRFALLGVLGLAVLAASTLATLARRHPRHARALVGAAIALTTLELLPADLPQRSSSVAQPFHAIADDPGDGAVLELPIRWYTGEKVVGGKATGPDDLSFVLHAIAHGQPIVSGAVSRLPDRRLDALLAVPVYRQVLALQRDPGFEDEVRFDEADLAELGIGYVAYDRDVPAPDALAYFQALDLAVLADDGTVIVWKVDP